MGEWTRSVHSPYWVRDTVRILDSNQITHYNFYEWGCINMERKTTISTHGSTHRKGMRASIKHNIREAEITMYESHIDPQGHYEIWHHEDLYQAYDRLFGAALDEYNDRQSRPCRRIANYLDHLKEAVRKYDDRVAELNDSPEPSMSRKGKAKIDKKGNPINKKAKPPVQPVRELIIGVYRDVDEDDRHAIIKEYFETWASRNPNLEIVGAYYHADEEGQPSLHLDYVPHAKARNNRGLSIQNNMEEALIQQGLSRTDKWSESVLTQWTARENDYLQQLVEARGYDVEHPQRGKHSKHKSTSEYKAMKEREKQAKLEAERTAQLNHQQAKMDEKQKQVEADRERLEADKKQLRDKQNEVALQSLKNKATMRSLDAREKTIQTRDQNSLNVAQIAGEVLEQAQVIIRTVKDQKAREALETASRNTKRRQINISDELLDADRKRQQELELE